MSPSRSRSPVSTDLAWTAGSIGAVVNAPIPSFQKKDGIVGRSGEGTLVGEHEIQVCIAVEVRESRVPGVVHRRQKDRRREAPARDCPEHLDCYRVRRTECGGALRTADDVLVAIAVEIPGRDPASEVVGPRGEDRRPRCRPVVGQHAVHNVVLPETRHVRRYPGARDIGITIPVAVDIESPDGPGISCRQRDSRGQVQGHPRRAPGPVVSPRPQSRIGSGMYGARCNQLRKTVAVEVSEAGRGQGRRGCRKRRHRRDRDEGPVPEAAVGTDRVPEDQIGPAIGIHVGNPHQSAVRRKGHIGFDEARWLTDEDGPEERDERDPCAGERGLHASACPAGATDP